MGAMDIVSILASPITEAGKTLIIGLKRQISFLTKYNENLENLWSQAHDLLEIKRGDVLRMVKDTRENGEEPYNEVEDWLKKTDSIEQVVAKLNREAQVNKRCFKGLCLDLRCRLHLSKHAVKTLGEVICLQEKGKFTRVSRKRPSPGVEPMPVDWVDFESRNAIMKEVKKALLDESITSIGVYGMGGIGKTTLMKSLNNKLLEERLFDKVIWVTVSQDPNLKEIQDNIGSRLGLKYEPEDSDLTRANKLLDRLKMENKVLLILDDLWEQLDVGKVGVPRNGEHKGCKIIITSRMYDVCIRMKIATRVEMKLLSEEESWKLFEAKAGNVTTLPSLKPIAEEIVRRCKGSPLAIVVLGSSLCEVERISRWRRALDVLENPYPGGVEGVMQETATSLRYSYEHLHGPEIKLCFLFCCLFPEDHNIDLFDLRNYGIAEGFLNANGGSLEKASDELDDYIEKLKNSCLLLHGDEEGFVKMHDVVRDVAIWIGSEDDNGFRVNIGPALGNWSQVDKLKICQRISFLKFNGNTLLGLSVPSEVKQLQLRSLLVRDHGFERLVKTARFYKKLGIQVPDSFLEKLKALVVLDLGGFLSVPKSVVHLTNLKALYLVGCDLQRSGFDILGGMVNLEILCLRMSQLGNLADALGNLTKLKCLDLRGALFVVETPNVISRLSNLEELLSSIVDPSGYDVWRNLEEASLVHLSRLEVSVLSHTVNAHSLPWKSLKQFRVAIDFDCSDYFEKKESGNCLYLGEMNPVTHWVSNTPSPMNTQTLFLYKCNGFNNILNLCEKGGFKNLEYLDLYSLPDLKCICEGSSSNGSLEKLEYLEVYQCNNLEYLVTASGSKQVPNLKDLLLLYNLRMENMVVWSKEEKEEAKITSVPNVFPCFQNLQNLTIRGCYGLKKKVFSFSAALGLQQLMCLAIYECFGIDYIIGKEEEEKATTSDGLLPQLQSVVVMGCLSIRNIYQGNLPLHSPNLKTIKVRGCPHLKTISLGSECLSTKIDAEIEKDERAGESIQQPPRPIGTSFLVFLISGGHYVFKIFMIFELKP